MTQTNTPNGFGDLNLPDRINQTLNRLQFTVPTPIQAKAIPVGLDGSDLIGIAKTGTGKTLAFGIPIAVRLKPGLTALVLVPTRELAIQVQENLTQLGLRTACVIGGAPMHRQVRELRSNPAVIVATPGRLIDHLNQRTTNLNRVSIVVLDEADRMFDMGFAPAVRNILDQIPAGRQTMMFSATMPKEICDLANEQLVNPVRVEIEPAGTITDNVSQEVWTVPFEQKQATLEHILYENKGSILVFTRTRHGARKLAKSIRILGHSADEIHSDRTLNQRQSAMYSFKTGAIRILVATDIAARGIDVKEIGLVLNFDVPENPEDYVHRIGRTGRAGSSGRAITLATPQQHRDIKDIERILNAPLPRFNASGIAEKARIEESSERRPNRNSRNDRPASNPIQRTERVETPRTPNLEPAFESRPEPRMESRPASNNRSFQPRSGSNHQPRSTSNAKRSGKPTWKRNDGRPAPQDRNGAMKPEGQVDRPNYSDNRSPRPFNPENRPQRPNFSNNRDSRPSNSDSRPGRPNYSDNRDSRGPSSDSRPQRPNWSDNRNSRPVNADSRPQRPASPEGQTSSANEQPWTDKRSFTPKAFKKPRKAKSFVTRQVLANKPKSKGPSRFERVLSSVKTGKPTKRK
jgi:ATP-dependent RNA helicase RhlE